MVHIHSCNCSHKLSKMLDSIEMCRKNGVIQHILQDNIDAECLIFDEMNKILYVTICNQAHKQDIAHAVAQFEQEHPDAEIIYTNFNEASDMNLSA